jgi:ribosomal protein S27E
MRLKIEKNYSGSNRVIMQSLFQPRKNPPSVKVQESFERWEDDSESLTKSPFDVDTCPHCFNTDCLYISDLVTCKECGHIVARPFDNTAEYRFFSQDDRGGDPTRVGAPQDVYDQGEVPIQGNEEGNYGDYNAQPVNDGRDHEQPSFWDDETPPI